MNYSHKISPFNKKIPEIEGIRAAAILMVLSFHFFARWTPPRHFQNVYPYAFEVTRQISQFGYLGVQLFFMVSGFVILRSLENQKNLTTFAIGRIERIFPSLLISVPVIFISCNWLNQSFIAPIPISSLLPSLTLIGPDFLNLVFNTNLVWTTGVLWSLFVEIQFYLIAGLLFFRLKKYEFVSKLFVFSLLLQFVAIFLHVFNFKIQSEMDIVLPLNKHIW
jgi:peptidoglycan/LPS O-acetylase OafA/YrhL